MRIAAVLWRSGIDSIAHEYRKIAYKQVEGEPGALFLWAAKIIVGSLVDFSFLGAGG